MLLRVVKTYLPIFSEKDTQELIIGAFLSHSDAGYELDEVVQETIEYLLSRLKQNDHRDRSYRVKAVNETCKVILYLGVLRGSLEDMLRLCHLI